VGSEMCIRDRYLALLFAIVLAILLASDCHLEAIIALAKRTS
jgi:hypothetical protein